MLGYLFLLLFILGGIWIVRCLFPQQKPLVRYWIGASFGLVLAMWLPALFAFLFTFNILANGLAVGLLFVFMGFAYVFRDKSKKVKTFDEEEKKFALLLIVIVVPMALFSGYLQYTHNLKIKADGSFWVGQSTYGDLSMHVSFITGIKNSPFPPEYTILPGARLNYPFLVNSLSTSLYLLGSCLQGALSLPGTVMMVLCYMGFLLIARETVSSKAAIILGFFLFFINGGLGFIYHFDLAGGTLKESLHHIFTGYYQTPTNQPDPYNLRWSNIIADMMVPQRTTLAGWMTLMPCIYLLLHTFLPKKLEERSFDLSRNYKTLIFLGIVAGAMPMIHTHSFLALALMSVGFLLYTMAIVKKERKKELLYGFLLYGAIAFMVALPQLITWTFKQSLGNESFPLQVHFNWANNRGSGNEVALIDNYFWFYLKNIGLPLLFLLPALFEKNKNYRFLLSGAFFIWVVAETIQFQPNTYDNNKLLYIAYLLCTLVIADYCILLFKKLKGLRGRWVLATVSCIVFFLSGSLTLIREGVSEYQAYSTKEVELAEYIKTNLAPSNGEKAVFLTGTQHLNPIGVLTGQKIVCGPDLWLYYHGFNTQERQEDIWRFYENPQENQEVLEKYEVNYIMISSYERNTALEQKGFVINQALFDQLYLTVYTSKDGEITIYQVKEMEIK